MSMQQVNLYLPELRPIKDWLTASTIIFSAVGMLCVLSVVYFLLKQSLVDMRTQVDMLEKQVSSSAVRLVDFSKNTHATSAIRLDQEIKTLGKAIREREQIGQIIRGQNLGNEDGFSEGMLSLAKQSLPSISLQHIKISRGGTFIEAKGVTDSAQDVPRYMYALREQKSFANTQFGLLSLVEDVSSRRRYSFTMGFDAISKLAVTGDAK